jgi:hypothetical protein
LYPDNSRRKDEPAARGREAGEAPPLDLEAILAPL